MRLMIAVVVMGLLACVSGAQDTRRAWANRGEYEMATAALGEKDPARMIEGLLGWEAAYPDSEFAIERAESLMYAYQRAGLYENSFKLASLAFEKEQRQIALLYKIISLGPMLKKRSPEQVQVIHKAANALLEEMKQPSIVAPADAKELAVRALALEVTSSPSIAR